MVLQIDKMVEHWKMNLILDFLINLYLWPPLNKEVSSYVDNQVCAYMKKKLSVIYIVMTLFFLEWYFLQGN